MPGNARDGTEGTEGRVRVDPGTSAAEELGCEGVVAGVVCATPAVVATGDVGTATAVGDVNEPEAGLSGFGEGTGEDTVTADGLDTAAGELKVPTAGDAVVTCAAAVVVSGIEPAVATGEAAVKVAVGEAGVVARSGDVLDVGVAIAAAVPVGVDTSTGATVGVGTGVETSVGAAVGEGCAGVGGRVDRGLRGGS